MISSYSFSQSYSNESAKEALKTIWLTSMVTGSQGCQYTEPDAYIYDPSNKNIIGQNFIAYSSDVSTKFSRIELTLANNSITGAKINLSVVILSWKNNRIDKITISGADCNCTVNYNSNNEVIGFTSNELRNKKQVSKSIEFKDGKLCKVNQYYDKPGAKKPWLHYYTTYTYNQNETSVNNISYKSGTSEKPDNLLKSSKIFKKINEHKFAIDEKTIKTELTYDENNILISRMVAMYGYIENYTFKYIDGVLFKETRIKTKDNVFVEKTIRLYSSLNNQLETMPNYEKTEGTYKFDVNDDMIFEKVKGKYREKTNGVWSDWKYSMY